MARLMALSKRRFIQISFLSVLKETKFLYLT